MQSVETTMSTLVTTWLPKLGMIMAVGVAYYIGKRGFKSKGGFIGAITLVVNDYDEAIKFYSEKVGFKLIQDTQMSETKRWVLIAPSTANDCSLVIAKAVDEEQKAIVGNQGGGRVWLFYCTDSFWDSYNFMKKNGVKFLEEPRDEVYGIVVQWQDLYGNKWDLIQKKM